MHRENAGGDLGYAGEGHPSPRLGVVEGESMTEEPAHLETPVGVVSYPTIVTEAKLARAGEAVLTEVVAPPPVVGEVVAGKVTAADVPSAPLGHEDTREVMVKVTGETSARIEVLEPPEPAAPSVQTIMSTFGTGTGVTAGPPLFWTASDLGRAPQGLLTARAAGSECAEAPPAPDTTTKGASGEKILVATAGSSAGSLSSANQLLQEWADTASSIKTSGKIKAQGNNMTLAELNRQLSAIKESLRNVNLQFLEASQTTIVSIMLSTFDFFYRLGGAAYNSVTNFSHHPSPRVLR
jgi:hypothetical protein